VPSEAAVRELCLAVIAIGARYAFVLAHFRPTEIGAAAAESGAAELFAAYQRAGVLRSDLPALWIANVFTALAVVVLEAHRRKDVDDADAAALLANTFLDGTRVAPDGGRARGA
jgi:hypothetical protein